MIFRNAATGERLPMEWDTYDPFATKYMYGHYTTTLYGGYKMEHCYKLTWPMEYERWEYEHITERNPFCDEFYDTPNPIFAIFDRKTGLPVKHIGQLEMCQRRSRTGYYYSNFEACVYGDKVAYTNGYTGRCMCATRPTSKPRCAAMWHSRLTPTLSRRSTRHRFTPTSMPAATTASSHAASRKW